MSQTPPRAPDGANPSQQPHGANGQPSMAMEQPFNLSTRMNAPTIFRALASAVERDAGGPSPTRQNVDVMVVLMDTIRKQVVLVHDPAKVGLRFIQGARTTTDATLPHAASRHLQQQVGIVVSVAAFREIMTIPRTQHPDGEPRRPSTVC